MKRMVTLAIVISFLLASETLFAKEKRGALIVVTKTDGTTIEEELITIKKDSTLLIESSSGVGGSIGGIFSSRN